VLKAPQFTEAEVLQIQNVQGFASSTQPVKDASPDTPKASPPLPKAPKAAPPVLKAAAPVVKVHLKARGSKTRQELEGSRLESITEV